MKLMMQLDINRASHELVKATEYLAEEPYIKGRSIGAVGFCMGGGLAMTLACDTPLIRAVAPFYGAAPDPIDRVQSIQGPIVATYAENDPWFGPEVREKLGQALGEHNKTFDIKVYPGTSHGFFNDTRPEVFDKKASDNAWQRVIELFVGNL